MGWLTGIAPNATNAGALVKCQRIGHVYMHICIVYCVLSSIHTCVLPSPLSLSLSLSVPRQRCKKTATNNSTRLSESKYILSAFQNLRIHTQHAKKRSADGFEHAHDLCYIQSGRIASTSRARSCTHMIDIPWRPKLNV